MLRFVALTSVLDPHVSWTGSVEPPTLSFRESDLAQAVNETYR